jgi:hypothetical protein
LSNELESTFQIVSEPKGPKIDVQTVTAKSVTQSPLLADFEKARSNIIDTIEVGKVAVTELGGYANSTQSADNYAALSSLIKSVSDLSDKLLKVHQTIETIRAFDAKQMVKEEKKTEITFTGTTADLQKNLLALRDQRRKETASEDL